jgi:excisionase family DNA binding protein
MTPELMRGERLLTIQEVSEWTGLAVGTLYHFVSQRRIPVVRLSKRCIRFRYSDLVLWISSLTQNSHRSNSDEKKK